MTEILSNVGTFITEYFDVALAIVGAAALIATKTPNKTDDKILQFILDAINFAGANLGKASNKDS